MLLFRWASSIHQTLEVVLATISRLDPQGHDMASAMWKVLDARPAASCAGVRVLERIFIDIACMLAL